MAPIFEGEGSTTSRKARLHLLFREKFLRGRQWHIRLLKEKRDIEWKNSFGKGRRIFFLPLDYLLYYHQFQMLKA